MNRFALSCLSSVMLIASVVPVRAQDASPDPVTAAKPEERLVTLEAELARQTRIADNARQEMGAMRAEMKLKDELLVLGRERNAELYAIAMEIAQKFIRSEGREPLIQQHRVRMENLLQSYEDRLRAARIYESTLPPSVQQKMNADLGAAPGQAAAPAEKN